MKLYAFKDVKIGFMEPFLQHNDETAIRVFKITLDDEDPTNQHLMRKYKHDIELWKLGEYDETTGDIIPDKQYLIGGKDT